MNNEKTRIAILGIGAVGGYFGGLLAEKYSGSGKVEIIFIARGANKKILIESGLKIISSSEEKIIRPDLISDNSEEIGIVDYLICTTKSYDLEKSILAFSKIISPSTVILPLQNGIDASDRLRKIFFLNEIWEGCVYIVSRLISPGVIQYTGSIHSLYFGSETGTHSKLKAFHHLLIEAGIEAYIPESIKKITWEKFLFISPAASLTSYFDLPIGEILNDTEKRNLLSEMLIELNLIALAKGIRLSDNIIEKTFFQMESLPPGTTSSMHSDFKRNHISEYRSLTEYVVQMGDESNIQVPAFKKICESLGKKEASNVSR
jgi:2-dehydropantoate 2-reductase